jgi:hypothetical protein
MLFCFVILNNINEIHRTSILTLVSVIFALFITEIKRSVCISHMTAVLLMDFAKTTCLCVKRFRFRAGTDKGEIFAQN